MAVSDTTALASVLLYVPWRGVSRLGPVGTMMCRFFATGDSGGGGVQARLSTTGRELGFPALYVPTLIAAEDGLATAEDVQLSYISAGIERINANITRVITMTDQGAANFGELTGSSPHLSIGIEREGAVDILSAAWLTNTDTKVYAIALFCTVYDQQTMASGKGRTMIEGPLAGPL